jgi:Reverse transcriptase (RNA-dependent DNA polymerase)
VDKTSIQPLFRCAATDRRPKIETESGRFFMAQRNLRPRDFLGCLLSTAYLPEELPPTVTSREYSEFCRRHYAVVRAEKDKLIKLATNYDTYSAPRNVPGRRALAVVHPLAQLGVSLMITERRQEIKSLLKKSGTSLYNVAEAPVQSKAFAGLDFKRRRTFAAKLHSEKHFILQADISRFFYTAYTHSIPWAVLGKEKAKELLRTDRKKLNAHWSSKIDEALQSCQSRETFGIPVGPDTSRILAELLLAGVEADKSLSKYLNSRNAFRLLDDFSIGFDDEGDAKQALRAIRQVLWKYNLQLNEEKTKIITSPLIFREKWKLDFDKAPLSQIDPEQQLRDIEYLVDLALNACFESRAGTPAQWACRRLSRAKVLVGTFHPLLDAMFRLSRDFPICISHVVGFLINNQALCCDPKIKTRVHSWIRSILASHLPQGHNFEVAWCLVAAGVLRIKLEEADVPADGTFPGSIVLALFGLLWERNLISFSLSRWDWRGILRKQGTFGENWLLLYEAVRRKWTNDRKLISHANGHALLSLALKENVAFLRDDVLDAQRINLDQRTYRPRAASVGAKSSSPKTARGTQKQAARSLLYGGLGSYTAELYDAEQDGQGMEDEAMDY